jgi:hypothetical protein
MPWEQCGAFRATPALPQRRSLFLCPARALRWGPRARTFPGALGGLPRPSLARGGGLPRWRLPSGLPCWGVFHFWEHRGIYPLIDEVLGPDPLPPGGHREIPTGRQQLGDDLEGVGVVPSDGRDCKVEFEGGNDPAIQATPSVPKGVDGHAEFFGLQCEEKAGGQNPIPQGVEVHHRHSCAPDGDHRVRHHIERDVRQIQVRPRAEAHPLVGEESEAPVPTCPPERYGQIRDGLFTDLLL